MNFWIVAGLMTAAALAAVLLPLWRARVSLRDRRAENLGIYRQRLRELEHEVSEGILPPEEVEATRAEIEKRLLDDVGDGSVETATGAAGARKPAHWTVFFLILLALPLGAIGLYAVLGTDWEPRDRVGDAAGTQPDAEMTELVANLARRLEENPDNGEGWALLGRSYLFLERPDKAAEAFARARELLGDKPGLMVDHANALAMQAGGDLRGRPEKLLREVLARAPNDPRALWLAGMAAAQRGDPERAGAHWRTLLQQLDPDSEDAAVIRRRLAELDVDTADLPGTTTEEGAAPAPGITVDVTLAPDIASRPRPADPVFVFARAADGPPMPLAVVRRQAADLPLTVRLDDDDAMVPERTLSGAERIIVGARISRSGGPIAQSGDLQGTSDALRPADTGEVRIVIDTVVP